MGDYYRPTTLRSSRSSTSSHQSRRSRSSGAFRPTESTSSQYRNGFAGTNSRGNHRAQAHLPLGNRHYRVRSSRRDSKRSDNNLNRRPRSPGRGEHDHYVDPPVMAVLHSEFDDTIAAFTRFPRQRVQYDSSEDHISPNPVYHPLYATVEQGAMNMNSFIAEMASNAAQHDHPSWDNFTRTIQMSSSPYISEPVRVAVIGDIGQGKSYLIGTLLGDMDIGNTGESITRVVLEYQHAPTTRNAKYVAKITLFPWETVESRLTQTFQHLINGLFRSEEEEDPEFVDQKFKTAWGVFKALFRLHPCFRSDQALKEFLSQSKHLPLGQDVRYEVLQWARVLYDKINGGIAAQPLIAQTAEQLWTHLMPFTHRQDDDNRILDFDPWPFVELVSIGGRFAVTERKVIIADTPGKNDVNHLNRDRTQSYLPHCAVTMIVSKIGRVLSESHGRAHLVDAVRRAGPGHRVIMVCTFSEDVQTSSRLHTNFTPEENDRLKHWIKKKDKFTQELHQFGPAVDDQQLQFLEFSQRLVDIKIRELFVGERNRRVKTAISTWYSQPASVFCVSASEYLRNSRGYRLRGVERLPISAALSELPALKQFVSVLATDIQQRELQYYISTTIPGHLNSMEMICLESTAKIQFLIPGGSEKQLKHCLQKVYFRIEDLFKCKVSERLLATIKNNVPELLKHAGTQCDDWTQWSHYGHRVFVLNYGFHKTRKIKQTSWNNTLLEPVRRILDPIFKDIIANIGVNLSEIEREVLSVMNFIHWRMKTDCPKPIPHELVKFLHGLHLRKTEMKKIVARCTNRLVVFFLDKNQRCCEDNDFYYFNSAMRQVYEKSSRARSPNKKMTVHQVRCETFKKELCNPDTTPYLQIRIQLKQACNEEKDAVKAFFEKEITAVFQAIAGDLERLQKMRNQQQDPQAVAVRTSQAAAINDAKVLLGNFKDMLIKSGVKFEE